MPTYEYACASCHRHTEAQQSFTDPPLTECPHCGGRLKRVFHPVGILLKGSGFYSTDNRSSRKAATDAPAKESGKETRDKDTASKSESSESSAKPASSDGGASKKESESSKKPEKKAKS
jgi:putative FmdB family regulatory protein